MTARQQPGYDEYSGLQEDLHSSTVTNSGQLSISFALVIKKGEATEKVVEQDIDVNVKMNGRL